MLILRENVAFVDEWYTWRVPVASALGNGLSLGFAKCSGLIIIAMQEEDFQLTSHSILISMAFNVSLMGLLSPLVGILTQRLTARLVSLTGALIGFLSLLLSSQCLNSYTHLFVIGLSLSVGFALVFSPPLLLNGVCFDRYRTRAAGLCFAGESLGCILMPLLITFLIDEYTVSGALLILSGLYLNLIPTSITLPTTVINKESGEVLTTQSTICKACNKIEQQEEESPDRRSFLVDRGHSPSQRSLAKKKHPAPVRTVLGFTLSLMASGFAYFNQLTIYPLFSHSNGIKMDTVSIAITLNGIVELLSRVGFAFICEKMSLFWKVITFGVSLGILSLFAQLLTVFVGNVPFLFMYVAILGLAGGIAGVMWTVIVTNLVGVDNSPRSLSFILMLVSLFTLILLCSMGYIREAIGSYSWVIRIGSISAIIAMLLQILVVSPGVRKLGVKTELPASKA